MRVVIFAEMLIICLMRKSELKRVVLQLKFPLIFLIYGNGYASAVFRHMQIRNRRSMLSMRIKTCGGLELEDIEKGGRLIDRKTVGERKDIGDKTVFFKGDILYSKLRPYLLKILIAPECGKTVRI